MQGYNLKLATPEDDFLGLLTEAIKESPYRDFPYTEESLKRTMALFTSDQSKRIVILLMHGEEPVGLIAGSVAPNLLCPQLKVATEANWYVLPEHRKGKEGLRLLDAYEYWADLVGSDIIIIANYGTAALDRLYKKRGYELVEHSFIKRLQSRNQRIQR